MEYLLLSAVVVVAVLLAAIHWHSRFGRKQRVDPWL